MKPRPLSCAAVALVIEGKTGWRPCRHTIKLWALDILTLGEHYIRSPGRFRIYPAAIDILVSEKVLKAE